MPAETSRSPSLFHRFANHTAKASGHPGTFTLALLVVLVWAVTGPLFGYSDTWQLVINTGTTVITFLMVFLIQNTQNRDSQAMHLKLDEIIRALKGADNALVDLEALEDEELEAIHKRYTALAEQARATLARGEPDMEAIETGQYVAGEHAKDHAPQPRSGSASRLKPAAERHR